MLFRSVGDHRDLHCLLHSFPTRRSSDLKDTFTGALFIDDRRIPQDQTKIIAGLGQVSFRPGPDKEISALRPGSHHATILYWPQEKGDEDAARAAGAVKSYTWQFTAG